jgi:hypothetical protein
VIAVESTVIAAAVAAAVKAAAAAVKAGRDNLARDRRGRVGQLCWLGKGRWCRGDSHRSSARRQHRCEVTQSHSHGRTLSVMAGPADVDKPANLFLTLPESRSRKAVSSPLASINAALLAGIAGQGRLGRRSGSVEWDHRQQ